MLTGKVVGLSEEESQSPVSAVNRLVNKMSEPVIRKAMHQAMKVMGHQFVLGRSIAEAQKKMVGQTAITALLTLMTCWVKLH
ncbi:hypothetical protein QW180_24460 [Vibrio sinaloensis]|nr:hypothetical protein [Vibrio sinaloensis]